MWQILCELIKMIADHLSVIYTFEIYKDVVSALQKVTESSVKYRHKESTVQIT